MPGGCKGKRGPRSNNRQFIDAVLWMARAWSRWRDLPERFGRPGTVKQRYYDWIERGVFTAIFKALGAESDLEWVSVDSTIVRAHQHAAGARWQKGGAHAQGLGRSRGGLSTKIHAATDSLGDGLRLIGGPGQENDIQRAADLIEGLCPGHVLADRAYDADRFHNSILQAGATPVIPPKRNRRVQHAYDKDIYKERNSIERFFNKLKHFRRVATRYDKLLANFMGFVTIAAIAIQLR
jgi:transposase